MVVAGENVLHAQCQKSDGRGPVARCLGLPTSVTQDCGGLLTFAEQALDHGPDRLIGYGQKLPMTERQAREETGGQLEGSACVLNEIESELDVTLLVDPRFRRRRFKPPTRGFDCENSTRKLEQPAAVRTGLGNLSHRQLDQAFDV